MTDQAIKLWHEFHTDMLFDLPMTSREQHLAAACFWFGITTSAQVLGDLSALARQAEAAGIASLACIQAEGK